MRMAVHVGFSLLLMAVVILFRYAFQDPHVINGLFRAAGFTYGPLLGLFAFGLLFRASPISGYAIPLISSGRPNLDMAHRCSAEKTLGSRTGL